MGHEIDESTKKYFAELDPLKRKDLLDELEEDECGILHRFYLSRYEQRANPSRTVDLWLWKCVYMPGLYKRRRFLKKAVLKEVKSAQAELYLCAELTEEERSLLYWEFRNAVRRYLSTCRSPKYASSLFGLKKATPDEQHKRAAFEIWKMSEGISRSTGFEKELQLWNEACFDELMCFAPECEADYRNYSSSFEK